jgi:hypothetical protein
MKAFHPALLHHKKTSMLNIKTIVLASCILLVLGFSSCFKDKYAVDFEDNTDRLIVEFAQGSTGTELVNLNLDFVAGLVDTNLIEIRMNPRSKRTGDVRVKVVVNNTLVSDYNNANGTSYTAIPSSIFTVQSYEVTIPQSTGVGYLRVKLNPAAIAAGEYAAGFSIAEISNGEISKLKQNLLVAVAVKNKYDGVYSVKGYAFLGANTSAPYFFDAPCSYEVWAVSTGPNSISLDAQPLYRNGTTSYGFNNVIPEFVFDVNTDKVTAVRSSQFATGAVIPLNFPYGTPIYDSRYDPVTKSIYVRFGVNNNPAWFVTDTLTYCGPR